MLLRQRGRRTISTHGIMVAFVVFGKAVSARSLKEQPLGVLNEFASLGSGSIIGRKGFQNGYSEYISSPQMFANLILILDLQGCDSRRTARAAACANASKVQQIRRNTCQSKELLCLLFALSKIILGLQTSISILLLVF